MTWIVGAVHLISAFALIGLVLLHSGKGGGGRPDMAQAGGPDIGKAEDGLAAMRDLISGAG